MATETLNHDPRYSQVLEHMQAGAWAQAQEILHHLASEFPDDTRLRPLLQEAAIKAEVDASWGENVGKPRLLNHAGRWLRWLGALALLMVMVYGALTLYRNVILPRQATNAAEAALQRSLEGAAAALEQGAFAEARKGYEEVLAQDPDNALARQGLVQVEQQLALQERYDEAIAMLAAGQRQEAIAALEQLARDAPGYGDVEQRLNSLQSNMEISALYAEAEAAFEAENWPEAIRLLEALRTQDGDYRTESVSQKLIIAYKSSTDALLAQPELSEAGMRTALSQLRRMVQLNPSDRAASETIRDLQDYLRGADAMHAGDIDRGLEILLPMYQRQPGYLNGALANEIFRAYLDRGDVALARGELLAAFDHYSQAASIDVADKGEAFLRMEAVGVGLTPTPTPTPTATPTVTPVPSATPAPEPTPPPLLWFKGWIAFLSDRDGRESLWVMRPDGSGQRRVNDDDKQRYKELYDRERWSPDGTTYVFASKAPGGSNKNVNLYIFRTDLPENWERQFMYTDWGGLEYDPVWSPDNLWISFVATHTGNDELWIMRSDGSEKTQLTFNDWEWDKHPTWSPDSQKIAFFSNRSGSSQIWIMNADGSGQTNLSDNEYNDIDPVWLK